MRYFVINTTIYDGEYEYFSQSPVMAVEGVYEFTTQAPSTIIEGLGF